VRTVTSEIAKRSLSSPTRTYSRSLITASIRSRRRYAGIGAASFDVPGAPFAFFSDRSGALLTVQPP
jgi:hypothetical protein